MLVLISDFDEVMEADYTLTMEAVSEAYDSDDELEIVIEPFGRESFYDYLSRADGLITAFIPIDDELLDKACNLKYISISAVGYSNLDLNAIRKRGIKVCHIKEYCTTEVAEHAIAMLMAINNNLKAYGQDIKKGNWNYANVPMRPTLSGLNVVIFGFGRIGRCTKAMLMALGCRVYFVDPFVTKEAGEAEGATKLQIEEVYATADVIINHMALTEDNYHLFDYEFFRSCKRQPIFINVGRGGCVEEKGLINALKEKLIYGAGLDVLEDEDPDLDNNPLIDMERVIMTPHAAFYSKNSIEKLQSISGSNLGYIMSNNDAKAFELI